MSLYYEQIFVKKSLNYTFIFIWSQLCVKSTAEPTQGLILLSIFFLSGFFELFFVCLSRVILSGGDKINETLFEYKTDTNLSRRSIFYFKLLSFTLFAVIDSAHTPQIVIAAIILFNIHSALKNLKKVRKVTRNFLCLCNFFSIF